jgi:uncharacterized protein (DUF2062 family)
MMEVEIGAMLLQPQKNSGPKKLEKQGQILHFQNIWMKHSPVDLDFRSLATRIVKGYIAMFLPLICEHLLQQSQDTNPVGNGERT